MSKTWSIDSEEFGYQWPSRTHQFQQGEKIKATNARGIEYDIDVSGLEVRINDAAEEYEVLQIAPLVEQIKKNLAQEPRAKTVISTFLIEGFQDQISQTAQSLQQELDAYCKTYDSAENYPVEVAFHFHCNHHWQVLGLRLDENKKYSVHLFDSFAGTTNEEGLAQINNHILPLLTELEGYASHGDGSIYYHQPYSQSALEKTDIIIPGIDGEEDLILGQEMAINPEYATGDCGVYAVQTMQNIANNGFYEASLNKSPNVFSGPEILALGNRLRAEQAVKLAIYGHDRDAEIHIESIDGIVNFGDIAACVDRNSRRNAFAPEILEERSEDNIDFDIFAESPLFEGGTSESGSFEALSLEDSSLEDSSLEDGSFEFPSFESQALEDRLFGLDDQVLDPDSPPTTPTNHDGFDILEQIALDEIVAVMDVLEKAKEQEGEFGFYHLLVQRIFDKEFKRFYDPAQENLKGIAQLYDQVNNVAVRCDVSDRKLLVDVVKTMEYDRLGALQMLKEKHQASPNSMQKEKEIYVADKKVARKLDYLESEAEPTTNPGVDTIIKKVADNKRQDKLEYRDRMRTTPVKPDLSLKSHGKEEDSKDSDDRAQSKSEFKDSKDSALFSSKKSEKKERKKTLPGKKPSDPELLNSVFNVSIDAKAPAKGIR